MLGKTVMDQCFTTKSVVLQRNSLNVFPCRFFCQEYWKESTRMTYMYNIFGLWNTILSSKTDQDLWSLLTVLATRSVFCLFWRWLPLACALCKPQLHKILLCLSAVGKETQTLLFMLLGMFPLPFLDLSTRSVPFSHIFFHSSFK